MVKSQNSPYDVLGITPFTSEKDAKTVYRNLVRTYHPDNPTTGDLSKFREVDKAWKEIQELQKKGSVALGKERKAWTHKTIFNVKSRR